MLVYLESALPKKSKYHTLIEKFMLFMYIQSYMVHFLLSKMLYNFLVLKCSVTWELFEFSIFGSDFCDSPCSILYRSPDIFMHQYCPT